MNLRTDLQVLLDHYRQFTPRGTPDYFLHQYLSACLPQWDHTVGGSFNSVPSAEQVAMPLVTVRPGLPTDGPVEMPSDVAFAQSPSDGPTLVPNPGEPEKFS